MYAPDPDRVPFRETDPVAPFCSYGIQKLAAEQYLRVAAERGILTATVLRVGNAYGTLLPQHRMQGLIGVAVSSVAHGRRIRVFGDQENVRDYVHLRDLCSMAWLAARPREPFTVVNVSSGEGHSVREILAIIAECHDRPVRIDVMEEAACSSRLPAWVVLNIDKARREFGWTPGVSIQSGIAEMLSRHLATARSQVAIAT
jgi:UDP-glucose 4-epimerase